tara:strand:- start:7380 stop:8048 length:669 start_codon:yes stop_codon:yes gene_type:complete
MAVHKYKTIKPLFKKNEGEDIYVLGSGPSLGFVDPSFFENKIVVAVNNTVHYVNGCKALYAIAKEPNATMQQAIKDKDGLLICTLKKCGMGQHFNKINFPGRTHIFGPKCGIAENTEQKEALEYSNSTIVSGIHLAAFLGAKNIILVGHDCGTIDEEIHAPDYDKSTAQTPDEKYANWMKGRHIEKQTLQFKKIIKKEWGVNIYSLNPFINYNLEGHTFKSF